VSEQSILLARVRLGLVPPEELPAVAVQAMERGCDSQPLRLLAGMRAPLPDEARRTFEDALRASEVVLPSPEDAVFCLARALAADILEGRLSPLDGATKIWRLTQLLPGAAPLELHTFIYAASEWPDRPEDGNVFAEGIVAGARDLVEPIPDQNP
jgi:hypothetical protein